MSGRRKTGDHKPRIDKQARKAVEFLASMCYHLIGDIGYKQIQGMLKETPPRRGKGRKT